MHRLFLLVSSFTMAMNIAAQQSLDAVYEPYIQTVKLFPQNNQQALPIINLQSGELLELHFDDMRVQPANYFYTYVLCNADWSETQWNAFDYIRGFQQNRISQYRTSSVSRIPYVHYQMLLPERNAMPSRSGNYLLKVYRDGDVSKVVFTKRFYVVDNKATIGAQIQQPFDSRLMRTHQKVQLAINTKGIDVMSPQQFNTVILQNGRLDNAITRLQPTFIRNGIFEFNAEQDCIFPAGKEYRWLDIRSLRFESDRVEAINQQSLPVTVTVRPDIARTGVRYLFYRDFNGFSEISNTESQNPWWQSEYAYVTFRFVPEKNMPLTGRNVYLIGELTNNELGDTSRMQFDASSGTYTKTLYLKQGYYSYCFTTQETRKNPPPPDPALTEGNYWETENVYSIFFYYRSLGGRHDELIGYQVVRSGI